MEHNYILVYSSSRACGIENHKKLGPEYKLWSQHTIKALFLKKNS